MLGYLTGIQIHWCKYRQVHGNAFTYTCIHAQRERESVCVCVCVCLKNCLNAQQL